MAEGFLSEWRHAVAGCVAGLTTVIVLHPLDVIKTRIQAQDGGGSLLPNYKGTMDCFRTILRREGIRGLYAGLAPCVIASGVSWSLYFLFYNRSKRAWRENGASEKLSSVQHLYSGMEAGVLVTLLTNPIWVLKTRFQLQEARAASKGFLRGAKYINVRQAISTMAKEEGLRGFYKGLGPSLLLCTNAAIQFAIYEELRRLVLFLQKRQARSHRKLENSDAYLSSGTTFVIAGSAKAVASFITYPTQVTYAEDGARSDGGFLGDANTPPAEIRHRPTAQVHLLAQRLRGHLSSGRYTWFLQRQAFYLGTDRTIYESSACLGLVPSMMRVVPNASLMFTVYEKVLQILDSVTKRLL